MAIAENAVIQFWGTEDQLTVASETAVSNGAFSAAADVVDWTNDDDAPLAMFKLALHDLSGAATAGDTVDLYCKPLNIESTADYQGPNANLKAIYLGSFQVDAVDPGGTADYYVLGPVGLPNYKTSAEYEFYIFNNLTTVNIDDGATGPHWDLWISPMTHGPHGA